MKSPTIWKWCTVLSLTFLPFAGGCLRAGSETNVPAGGTEFEAANSLASTDAEAAALEAAATNAPAIDISEAEVTPIQADPVFPSAVRAEGPAGDLLKLASSGVEDKVMLAFITNSPSVFDLSADEIIYLNDLGVSGDVIAATMHRDQVLKAAGVASNPASTPEPPPTTAPGTPQYTGITTNWIGAAPQETVAQQPDPSQVAPQSIAPPPPDQGPQTEQAPVAVAPPQTEVTYSTFYSSLAPYGRWLEVDGYGRVWQPTVVVVNSNWSPYFDSGRWVYTDLGWYWHSDYSWGWAPFHYGRWFRHHRIGWCWTPDLVWGPSWVTWRYNDAYCGWAPLPPAACYRPGFGFTYYGSSVGWSFGFGLGYSHYNFVHWDRFHHHHRNHLHAVPIHDRHHVYNNTRPVTKIVSKNNHIINEGPSAQRVARATRTELKPVAVREVKTRNFTAAQGRGERLDPAKRTLTVYKPQTPKGEVGGIPMERIGRGGNRATPSNIAERSPGGAGAVASRPVSGDKAASGVESRFSRSGSTSRPTTTPTAGSTTTSRSLKDRSDAAPATRPPSDRDKGSRTVEARPGTRPAPAASPVAKAPDIGGPAKPAVADKRQEPASPRPAPSVESRSQQRSVWASPRTAEKKTAPERPSVSGSPAQVQPRSPVTVAPPQSRQPASRFESSRQEPSRPTPAPSIASPKVTEAPARIERRAPTSAPSVTAPSGTTRQPSVWSSPRSAPNSQVSPAPSSPSRQFSSPSTAPRQFAPATPAPSTSRPSAPVQRQYSAPAPAPRQYSAPSPAPRQYSAPQASSAPRGYSPAPSVSAAPRSYSPPQSASSSPRSFSPAPSSRSFERSAGSSAMSRSPAPSPSPRSYSAPSGGSQRSSPAPAPSSSRGGFGGGRGRSDR